MFWLGVPLSYNRFRAYFYYFSINANVWLFENYYSRLMINFLTKLLLYFGIGLAPLFITGQTNEIQIKFIGNCGLYMTDGTTHLYVDFPYKSGAYNYMEYENEEIEQIKEDAIFLFTHKHADHYSNKLLKPFEGEKYGPWNVEELEELGSKTIDFQIEPFRTEHKVYGISFKHYSYVITWHGKRIFLSGDTGDVEVIKSLKELDLAFMNPWMFMNLQNERIPVETKMFGIYHLYPNEKLPEKVPSNIIFLKEQGRQISISYE